MGFKLFSDLDDDWRILVASRAAQQALDRWTDDPILAAGRHLDELLARTARHADRDEADAVLRALLRRSSHDELAARTVLQALVPGLVRIARKIGAQHDSEQAAEVVAVAWTKIRCGDWSKRRGLVAGHLLLDVFHVVWRTPRRPELAVAPGRFGRLVQEDEPVASTRPTGRDVLEDVARTGRVEPEQLCLIRDAVVDQVPLSLAARRAGITAKAMTRRRDRARARVVQAYTLARSA
jgi:hypothetical protein